MDLSIFTNSELCQLIKFYLHGPIMNRMRRALILLAIQVLRKRKKNGDIPLGTQITQPQ